MARKTLGVIGTGNIGKAVIRRAKGFDMKILAYDVIVDIKLINDFSIRYFSLRTC